MLVQRQIRLNLTCRSLSRVKSAIKRPRQLLMMPRDSPVVAASGMLPTWLKAI